MRKPSADRLRGASPRDLRYANFIVAMRFRPLLKSGVLIVSAVLWAQGQETPTKEPQNETKGLPARVATTDYLSHVQAGAVTLAAEFKGHSVPTLQATFTNEDFVV